MSFCSAGIPCFIALGRPCVFYIVKVCGNLALSNYVGIVFPTAFADFLSLSYFDNCLSNAYFFVIVILVMIICDQ